MDAATFFVDFLVGVHVRSVLCYFIQAGNKFIFEQRQSDPANVMFEASSLVAAFGSVHSLPSGRYLLWVW